MISAMPFLLACAACLAALLAYGYCSNFFFRAEHYKLPVPGMKAGQEAPPGQPEAPEWMATPAQLASPTQLASPARIVMLADLHGMVFGRNNERLLRKIVSLSPDLICIAGDMTVKDGSGSASCIALCRELTRICPVYYAMGNHEIRMENYLDFCAELRKTGVFVLDNEHVHFFAAGKKFVVHGWNADEAYYHKCWQKRVLTAEELSAQLGVPEPGAYHILLAHNPEYFPTYCAWGADLVLSGHVHGGIARLPFAGGVIAPSLRLFPRYDAGEFREGNKTMILSRGLGTHHIRLRFFNVPEMSVIDLYGKDVAKREP